MIKKLTRKQIIQHIRETMPEEYNEYERLAFIEYEIAKNISFDEKYLWGEMGTSEKIYKLAKREAQNPKPEVKRKLICVTMAELFGYVAKEFGFKVRYQSRRYGYQIEIGEKNIFNSISEKEQEHVCPVITLSDGKSIEVDIQYDLERLQTRSKPRAFGQRIHLNVDGGKDEKRGMLREQLVEETFRKIYGLKEDEKFTDEYIMILSLKLYYQGKKLNEMIDFFINDSRIKEELLNIRCIEASKIYRVILRQCYNTIRDEEFFQGENQYILEECILSDNKGRKKYSFCIYAEDKNGKVLYIYSKKSRRMIKLSQKEIQQLTEHVMNVEVKGEMTSLKRRMMDFVSNNDKCEENQIGFNNELSIEDIFLDEDEEELE